MGFLEIRRRKRAAREGGVGTQRDRRGERRGGTGNLVPECSFTYICAHACARACENEPPGEVIHCSAETNACVRACACTRSRRAAALSSEIRSRA